MFDSAALYRLKDFSPEDRRKALKAIDSAYKQIIDATAEMLDNTGVPYFFKQIDKVQKIPEDL
ncbi:hypothetical protein [Gilvibacter sp.]|uniref:hypothetical protein n=1 Tax=Gilvibacter sp. TaxID=2729997 RepID=UPI0025B8EE3F|nr:hypothetical protein [Gilvibacter sp.]NQX77507.1 hypothetical protein [Gilvibacter sp.]